MKRERVVLLGCLLLPAVILTLTFMATPWNYSDVMAESDSSAQLKGLDVKLAKAQLKIDELSSQVEMNVKHRDQLHERVKQLESANAVVAPAVALAQKSLSDDAQMQEAAAEAQRVREEKRETDALREEAKDLVVDDITQDAINSCKRLVAFSDRDVSRCPETDPFGKSCRTPATEKMVAEGNCLIYSVGIADWWEFDKYYGARGCEVHSFDPTVKHPENLAPGVTFHHWGMRGSTQKSLSDDAVKGKEFLVSIMVEKMGTITGKMMTLQEIRKELGHEDREITILKLDCEGCEWGVLEDLAKEVSQGDGKSYVMGLAVEYHFQLGIGIDVIEDVHRIQPVEEFITKHYQGPASYFRTGTHPRDAKLVDELKLCLPRANYIAEIAYVRDETAR